MEVKMKPHEGLSNFMCQRCGGIMLGDMPRKWLNHKIYHPHCADKEEHKIHIEEKKKEDK